MKIFKIILAVALLVLGISLVGCNLVGLSEDTSAGNGDGSDNKNIAPACARPLTVVAVIRDTISGSGSGGAQTDTVDLSSKWQEAKDNAPDMDRPYTMAGIRVRLDNLSPSGCEDKTISGTIGYRVLKASNDSVIHAGGDLMTIDKAGFCKYKENWLDPQFESAATINADAVLKIKEIVQETADGTGSYKLEVSSDASINQSGSYTFDVIVELSVNGNKCINDDDNDD